MTVERSAPEVEATMAPVWFGAEARARAHEEMRALDALLRRLFGFGLRGARLLDFPSGRGLHAIAATRAGAAAEGVVSREEDLAEARAGAEAAGTATGFTHAATWEPLEGGFDLAVSIASPLGCSLAEETEVARVRQVRTTLRPRGVLVAAFVRGEAFAMRPRATRFREAGGYLVQERMEPSPDLREVAVRANLWRDGDDREVSWRQRVASLSDLVRAVRTAGFETEPAVFGELDGSPLTAHAEIAYLMVSR